MRPACVQVLDRGARRRLSEEKAEQPLPLAPKTACAYLLNQADEEGRKAYDGTYQTSGERDDSPDLRRYFTDYDSLVAVEHARELWTALYGPLVAADWQALEVPA